jgi:hypothetical protein
MKTERRLVLARGWVWKKLGVIVNGNRVLLG